MTVSERWAKVAETRELEPGEYVFKEGDPGDMVCFVGSGQVAIVKGVDSEAPLILSYRGEGTMLGEIALLRNVPRSASVMATEPTTLYVVSSDAFWHNIDTNPEFRRAVLNTLIDRLLAADENRFNLATSEKNLIGQLESLSSEQERIARVMLLRQETIRFVVNDLHNPLSLVMVALSMIEREIKPEQRENLDQHLTMAVGAVQRMMTLAEVMLDVERLEEKEPVLELEDSNIGQMLYEIVEELQPMAHTFKVALLCNEIPADLPEVRIDLQYIERVITNLIDNGLKFTPSDGTVTVSSWQQDAEVFVAVNDTGSGIPADIRPHIFDRFSRLESNDDRVKGFGLGLAFSRLAVEAHSGRIWIEDGQDGVGTRLVFTLPVN